MEHLLMKHAAILFLLLAAAGTAFCDANGSADKKARIAEDEKISVTEAAILGTIEGLTEYLPVSSTGHLILANHALDNTHFSKEMGLFGPKLEASPASSAFEIVIQLGAILAVLGLYRKRVKDMGMGLIGRNRNGLRVFLLLITAFLPAAITGFLLEGPIKENLFNPIPVAWSLAAGGVLMIIVERFYRSSYAASAHPKIENMLYSQALIIGFAQCLAMWPGTSRSMITIIAAMLVGLDLVTSAEFSFLLALPTLGAATIYEAVKNWDALLDSAGWASLTVGVVLSWVVAAIAVKLFVKCLTRFGLVPFGVYRILLAAAVYAYFNIR